MVFGRVVNEYAGYLDHSKENPDGDNDGLPGNRGQMKIFTLNEKIRYIRFALVVKTFI